ncbi:patatin-like phospholipase family protein [Psychromonas sp. KJ10-10]|uniref:patatin-like phospholipase family protein n=1 Tax=Psychromonas sp. KJ10-10 TaxID=3391823 RepID=UPI0039B51A6D
MKSKTLGIAFGGGGLRGYMHLGIIRALEENNITADLVTGSSAGSIATTFYASGKSYAEIENIITEFSEFDVMDFVLSPNGIVNGQNLAEWINANVLQEKLSQMTMPIGITATNMTTLESVLIIDGDPGEAVQTSSTIPGAFVPVEHDHHLLVDGGILNVVPVHYAKSMGAKVIIAVDIYCANQPQSEIKSLSMQLATFRLLACRHSEQEINSADIVIRPDYEPEGNGLFSSKQDAIDAGYQAMLTQIPKLKALLK